MADSAAGLSLRSVAAIAAALALLAGGVGRAAPAADELSTGTEDPNAPVRMPVITVVAQKEPADPQRLPVSVTAISGEALRDADVRFVKEAELFAPNVTLNEFSARKLSNPYFRGIGASPNNPGITTYYDGVPQLNANSSSLELIDVDQIEFVRGPQGALFGRNTVGGLINVLSRRPSMFWRGDLTGEYGNYDYRDVRLTLSGPIAEKALGMSLAAGYSARDGFTQNDYTGNDLDSREAFFGKGQVLWTPSEAWDVRFLLSGERARDGDYALGDLAAIRANPHHVSHDYEGYTRRDVLAPTLLAEHHGAQVDFASTTGGVWWKTSDSTDLDYSPYPLATRDNNEKDFQFTQEFRLASAKDAPVDLSETLKLKWQLGLSVFTQNYDQDAENHYAAGVLYQPGQYGPGLPPYASPANTQHSPQSALDDVGLGAYGQATLSAWEKLDFTVGLRGDYESKSADLNTYFATPDPFLGPPTRLSPSDDFCEVSPQFGLAYRLTPDQIAYASVSRGYKAGGFNPTSPPGQEAYGQESSWNYEVGAKTAWCDDRLTLNLAFFYIHWSDLQLNQPTGAPGQFYIANAGDADSKGVELQLNARPVRGWDVFGGVGYTDARFLSGATAGHVDASGATTAVDVGGRHLIYTPDFTASGGMQYSLPVSKQATVYARGEAVAYGRFFYDPVNAGAQDTYCQAHFRAGVRGKNWFAEGWVRNAFDAHYVPIAFEYPNGAIGGSGFVGESGAPITFGVRAGLSF